MSRWYSASRRFFGWAAGGTGRAQVVGRVGLVCAAQVGWAVWSEQAERASAEEEEEELLAPQTIKESSNTHPHKGVKDVIEPAPEDHVPPAIYKIVLTGGPCGGKSTAVSLLTRRLESLGFKIFIVPEAATLLFTGGARFEPGDLHKELAFESNKIRTQMALEDSFEAIAKASKRPAVIICDRGTMDSYAYVGPEKWSILLQENGWTVSQLRDNRYDAVLHLVTTAIGAEEFYNIENNKTRMETPQQAIQLDLKILNAWVGHPKVFIVDNSTDFNGKMNRVVTSICRLLGVPRPKSTERKFLVKSFHLPRNVDSAKHYTETTFLLPRPGKEDQGYTFLRKRGDRANTYDSYMYSAKKVFSNGESAVVERQISGMEYNALLAQQDNNRRVVQKKVRVFEWDNRYYELNYFITPHEGLVILKTEAETSTQQIEVPAFLQVIREVTDDPRFSTYSLASDDILDWVFSPVSRPKS